MTEPMTPPDCDLRDYPWMPLDCTRLLTSETWILGTSDQKVAALTLWCKSWHQVPAGSLPANDRVLGVLSEVGARGWSKVRDHAMRGWVLCSDGRLYHPVVAEKANVSWELKIAQRARTQAARDARLAKRVAVTETVTTSVTETNTKGGSAGDSVETAGETHGAAQHGRKVSRSEFVNDGVSRGQVIEFATKPLSVTETVTGSIRTEQNKKERKKEPPSLRDQPPTLDASPSAPPTPSMRGCRIPDDWTPSNPEFAGSHGVDQSAALVEFRDYWRAVPGKAGVKLDWEATWRNQIRHIAAKPKKSGYPLKTSQMPVPEQNAELMRIMDRLRGSDDETPHHQLRIVQ